MDPKVWSSVNNASQPRPVDTYWPGRFLEMTDKKQPANFSLAGTEGSWLPFGSGANLCPGRNFAKMHCILTLAMMVECFDCEILAKPKDLMIDLSKFGMGVLGPSGKIPVRMRRRVAQ